MSMMYTVSCGCSWLLSLEAGLILLDSGPLEMCIVLADMSVSKTNCGVFFISISSTPVDIGSLPCHTVLKSFKSAVN